MCGLILKLGEYFSWVEHVMPKSCCMYYYYPDIDVLWYSSTYRQVSNIRRTLAGNEIVDHSDEAGASPVGAAPTTSSFST